MPRCELCGFCSNSPSIKGISTKMSKGKVGGKEMVQLAVNLK